MSELDEALELARRLFGRVAARDWRSHDAIRMYVAQLGLVVRAARRDPVTANDACRRAGIKGKRIEVRMVRLVAGRRIRSRSDQVPRWANAAAYIAHPPNGDGPPSSLRDAIRYINRRGGVRNLSDLYAGSRKNPAFTNRFDENAGYGSAIYYAIEEDATTEWFTPKYVFDALGCRFDLDPASPGQNTVPWIPTHHHYTTRGLEREWFGLVWLNPPYGRNVLPLWLEKFTDHGNGIALVPERTSTGWWQELVNRADLVLFVNKKIPFIGPTGEPSTAFPIGSTLVAMGDEAVKGLLRASRNGLGILLKPMRAVELVGAAMAEAAD